MTTVEVGRTRFQEWYHNGGGREWHRRRWIKYKKENPAKLMLSVARTRAKRKGLEFDITEQDILPLPNVCPVLGTELKYPGTIRDPDSASLDRIDNSKGYVRGNVVVISLRANVLKRDATSYELKRLADYYCK